MLLRFGILFLIIANFNLHAQNNADTVLTDYYGKPYLKIYKTETIDSYVYMADALRFRVYDLSGVDNFKMPTYSELNKKVSENILTLNDFEICANEMIILFFIIDTAGNIDNIRIVKGIDFCPKCNTNAKAIVKKFSGFTAGKSAGQKVPVFMYYSIPYKF